MCFEFTDVADNVLLYWLLKTDDGVELCVTDPGYEVDLYITTDARTMTEVWNGDTPISTAIERGTIDLHGPKYLCKAFPSWLQLSLFASIGPARSG